MYCPSGVFAAGRSTKRTVCTSSSRVKLTGCTGGVVVHPDGASMRTSPVVAPLAWFATVMRTSRSTAAVAPRPAATIAIGGVTRNASLGTTVSSIRFSPSSCCPS